VKELPAVRALTCDDLLGCRALSERLGWPWEEPKWRLLIQHGKAFGIDAPDGGLVGTVVLNCFGGAAASIGLMGVAPGWRRRGLGRALMARALAQAGRVPTFLYASRQGEGLYRKLGFTVAGSIRKFIGPVGRQPNAPPFGPGRVRPMRADDFGAVVTLDALAFGAPRAPYLAALFQLADQARLAEDDGKLVGYGLGWSVGTRRTLGPLVAVDDVVAEALATELLEGQPRSVRMDIPSGFPALERWALGLGLVSEAPTPLMVLNAEQPPGRRQWLYTVAMQGLG
jgi:GNAT superfamily N-acetyltransferase